VSARTDILAALRSAVPAEGSAPPAHTGALLPPAVAGLVDPEMDAPTLFRMRLVEHGGECLDMLHADVLADMLAAFLARHTITSVLCAADPLLEASPVQERLRAACGDHVHQLSDAFIRTPEQHRSIAARTTLGIGRAAIGIADSGVIVVPSMPAESRALSLLTDAHLAFLYARDIVMTLADAMPRIAALRTVHPSAAVMLIGGPSKTADIEKVLVTGVHGPRTFAVALIND
jgi:L-lactate utilization protein LutC